MNEPDNTETIRDASDSTVDDWHGQDVARDTAAAERAVDEADGDLDRAAKLFEEERPEHRADKFNVPAVEREGTLDDGSADAEHATGEAMAAHNAEVDPPA